MPPPRKHGRTLYFIEGEGFTPDALPATSRQRALGVSAGPTLAAAGAPPAEPARAFRFCRLFPALAKFEPDVDKLVALGAALTSETVAGDPSAPTDAAIPAGFTYFGQFVDHDITFDRTELVPAGSADPAEIESGRSPALELDSMYGRGPDLSAELYEADKVRLRVGATSGRSLFGVTATLPNDVPRKPAGGAEDRQAEIGDPRNDENLIVAQTHVAFLKFHNAVVGRLAAAGAPAAGLFEAARKTVVQHYQSIVLHDFVARLCDPEVFADVLANGRKVFRPGPVTAGDHLCMPVEFSVAAYRLGHSMVRSVYQWNDVFSSTGLAGFTPQLSLFFTFSRVSGDLGGGDTLFTDWAADWRRLYDFSEAGGSRHPQLNFARPIDSRLAGGLSTLPEFAAAPLPQLRSLASRNLLRGRQVGLPTGQDVAAALGESPLTPAELAGEPHGAVVAANGFDTQTPLWFYILKEAEVRQGGQRLGRVGSRLVAETFHGLIAGSDHSILATPGWKASLTASPADKYTMVDLLTLVDDIDPVGKALSGG